MMRYLLDLFDPVVHLVNGELRPKLPFWKRLLNKRSLSKTGTIHFTATN